MSRWDMMDLLYMDLSSEFGLKIVDLRVNIKWTYEGLNRYTMGYVTIGCQHMFFCLIVIILLLNNKKYFSNTDPDPENHSCTVGDGAKQKCGIYNQPPWKQGWGVEPPRWYLSVFENNFAANLYIK